MPLYYNGDPGLAQLEDCSFIHCRKCVEEWTERVNRGEVVNPKNEARLSVSSDGDGIQVWCVRHECNVAMIWKAEEYDQDNRNRGAA